MPAVIVILVLAALAPIRAAAQPPSTAASNVAAREVSLKKRIAAAPADLQAYLDLAQLQEDFGAVADAEATLLKARQAVAAKTDVLLHLAGFYGRRGQFEKPMEMLRLASASDPQDPEIHSTIAAYHWDKALKDHSLRPAQRATYIGEGIAAADRAIAIDPDYPEVLVYKGFLLQMRAELATNAAEKARIMAEANALRSRATELRAARALGGAQPAAPRRQRLSATPTFVPAPPPPPPPPPPTATAAPVRVGGDIKPPVRIKSVSPAYPVEAVASRTQGTVIVEATIDSTGGVSNATIRRSIPSLDQAALEAVRQWVYEPTLVNGLPVPVIMTVTVSFTLQ